MIAPQKALCLAAMGLGVCLGGLGACGGGSSSGPAPKVAVANTPNAQRAFRRIELHWRGASAETSRDLELELQDFLRRYPHDGHVDTARTYLAWLYVERGEHIAARHMLEPALEKGSGATLDFGRVVQAAIWLEEDRAEQAYVQLVELRGKLIDQQERALHLGVLVRATHKLGRYVEAAQYMFEWLEQAPPTRQQRVIVTIGVLVRAMPPASLEEALKKIDVSRPGESRPRRQARQFLAERFRLELRREALEKKDVNLAKRLLDATAARGERADEQLKELAAGKAFEARVEGRTIGLVLELAAATSRQRSSEVAAGISTTLSLATNAQTAENVRLSVREAKDGDVRSALAQLASAGAVVLVAGVTSESAAQAADWAERRHVPVLLMQKPAQAPAVRRGFSFVLGAAESADETLFRDHFAQAGVAPLAVVESTDPGCDATAFTPGAPRFPVGTWKKEKASVLVLLASGACSRAAVRDSQAAGLKLSLALGLEAAPLALNTPAVRWVVGAGPFPFMDDAAPEEIVSFRAARGRVPNWYESLGHDAAVIAQAALARLPVSTADDAQRVSQLQDLMRLHLSEAKVSALWTTEARGFARAYDIDRQFGVVDLSKR